jgi:hypothetical protein
VEAWSSRAWCFADIAVGYFADMDGLDLMWSKGRPVMAMIANGKHWKELNKYISI